MTAYEQYVYKEMLRWQNRVQYAPGLWDRLGRNVQNRINKAIPEKVHHAITVAFREMVRSVLGGAAFISGARIKDQPLELREYQARETIHKYRNTAAVEGAVTGAGGILLGLADFPAWLAIKMKMLFDIAALYGMDVRDYRERMYILYIFQLAFSGAAHRLRIYELVNNWETHSRGLPDDLKHYDWRSFQQEYRDYLDVAKLLQLVPGIGAVVGAVVNHRLTRKLGDTAMNAYRMRWFSAHVSGMGG